MLSDSESEAEGHQLTVNEHFAKAYARKKEREELTKLKEKYGSDAEEDDESDSEDESEDEDGEELTPAVDAAILRTLARIKKKDPDIYDAEKGIFEEEQLKTRTKAFSSHARKDKAKPLLMRQHALNSVLASTSRSPSPEPEHPTHAEEQKALRHETIDAFHHAIPAEDEAEDDGLFIPREKTKDEQELEEEEYHEFLTREVGEDIGELVTLEDSADMRASDDEEEGEGKEPEIAEASGTKGKKKNKKKKKKVEEKKETDHEFLMSYILNRGWIDRSARHVPTYSEVTGPTGPKVSSKADRVHENEVLEEKEGSRANVEVMQNPGFDEEEFDEVADTFESSYNFRFEEPDAALIPAHPRTIDSLVRRQDSTRKDARERKKERKEEKLLRKREEVKRMKALKMKELREKLERIGKEGGKNIDEEAAFAELDLEGDWDPDAHDQQMAGIYDNGDGDGEDEDLGEALDADKPAWDDDIDIADIIPPEQTSKSKKKKKKKKDESLRDEGIDVDMMDADIEKPNQEDEEEWDGTDEMRKRKLDEYLDEIYGMEFNDMVGDMPTRFKYTPVLPQQYGLTPAEILVATDAELNQYIGVKKYAPYRKGGTWDQSRGERLKELKDKLKTKMPSDNFRNAGADEGERPAKKRKGKKERQKAKLVTADGDPPATHENSVHEDRAEESQDSSEREGPAKKKRRRHKKGTIQD